MSKVSFGQSCNLSTISAKYWQYRENLNRHFVVTDRDPIAGCVNDGIGQDETDPCKFSKGGYSLPATSIYLENNAGFGAQGDRGDESEQLGNIYGPDCIGDFSWNSSAPTHTYNWTEYGVETLTQLGWYLVTLCTEYELLRLNGQTEQQQKTLEDIFLALQAVRRLDMQTQCLLQTVYMDRVAAGGGYLCSPPFVHSHTDHNNGGNGENNFDSNVKLSCAFTADFSGYNGFFIREDATPELEAILHDPTNEAYNVDGIGSAFSVSVNDPTIIPNCPPVDRFCYLVKNGRLYSQDQIINLLNGLAYVKRFIPASATVTTCKGEEYHVLEIAQKIAEGIINHIDAPGNHNRLWVPGSKDCCDKPVKISMGPGGLLWGTMHGMVLACNYITGKKRRSTLLQRLAFEATAYDPTSNVMFYYVLSSIGKSHMNDEMFTAAAFDEHKEIFLLGQDILHPEDLVAGSSDVFQNYFKMMLCDAPCGGPCRKGEGFDSQQPEGYYPEFTCANTPNWMGQRWEANDSPLPLACDKNLSSRQFNGIDFMALFNLYALKTQQTMPFYNPDAPAANPETFIADGLINGPSYLCPDQIGTFSIQQNYTGSILKDIIWTASDNIKILTPLILPSVEAKLTSTAEPSYVAVDFSEVREIDQRYGGDLASDGTTYPKAIDVCQFSNRKEIISGAPNYTIESNFAFCGNTLYTLRAIGDPVLPDLSYSWTVKDAISGQVQTATGGIVTLVGYENSNHMSVGEITLVITNPYCNTITTVTQPIPFHACNSFTDGGDQLMVFPNPGRDEVSVAFIKEDYSVPDGGVPIRITNTTNGQVVRTSKVYSKVSTLNTADLQDGSYNIQAIMPDASTISTSFTIFRN